MAKGYLKAVTSPAWEAGDLHAPRGFGFETKHVEASIQLCP